MNGNDDIAGQSDRRLTVLVVDDDKWARVLLDRILTHKGHRVMAAATGREAVDIVRRVTVDIVITDRVIPDLSGDEVAAEVKRLSPLTPVIMLTGLGDMMQARREQVPGVDCVLAKQISFDDLYATIERVALAPRQAASRDAVE